MGDPHSNVTGRDAERADARLADAVEQGRGTHAYHARVALTAEDIARCEPAVHEATPAPAGLERARRVVKRPTPLWAAG